MPIRTGQPSTGPFADTLATLRASSIAYTRLPDQRAGTTDVTINQVSHTLTPTYSQGALSALQLDGEPLPGTTGQTTATDGVTYVDSETTGNQTRFDYRQGKDSTLQLAVRAEGDRLQFTYHYVASRPADHALLVATQFHLPGDFISLQTLNWRRQDQFLSTSNPTDPYAMAQFPFVTSTTTVGNYLGVLDTDAGSLFAQVDKAASTSS